MWTTRIVRTGSFAVLLSCLLGCAPSGPARPVSALPPQPDRPTTLERAQSMPDDAPARVPTATPVPEPPKPAPPKSTPPTDTSARPPSALREILPGVRADLAAKLVEFDGIVPLDCHNPQTPDVFLEVTVCTRDTKEHESLVMTRATASNVHAALLAIGLQPGAPGRWNYENRTFTPVPPRGSPVRVTLAYFGADGKEIEAPATDWIINAATKAPFQSGSGAPGRSEESDGFVFAGSRMAKHEGFEVYDADGVGTVVGLCTFGAETVAWSRVISPDSDVSEPEWIADPAKVPAFGTPVVVRIRPAASR